MADISVPYFFARPAAAPPWPGVVVVPEGNGMSPQLLRVCQRLAGEGYAAAAPDIFWRLGGSDPQRSLHELGAMRMRDLVQDVSDTADVLRAAGATKVGVTGFCLGGRVAYAVARSEAVVVDAAAPFYGAGIDKLLGTANCPLLLFYGGRDEYINADEIDRVRAQHGDDVVVYAEGEHGFMRDGSGSYNEPAAADAWSRLLTFFEKHLGPQ